MQQFLQKIYICAYKIYLFFKIKRKKLYLSAVFFGLFFGFFFVAFVVNYLQSLLINCCDAFLFGDIHHLSECSFQKDSWNLNKFLASFFGKLDIWVNSFGTINDRFYITLMLGDVFFKWFFEL